MAKKLGMTIDLKRCMGCHTCALSCKMQNNVPMGMLWNRILTVGGEDIDTARGEFPNLQKSWMPLACLHCENALRQGLPGRRYLQRPGRTGAGQL